MHDRAPGAARAGRADVTAHALCSRAPGLSTSTSVPAGSVSVGAPRCVSAQVGAFDVRRLRRRAKGIARKADARDTTAATASTVRARPISFLNDAERLHSPTEIRAGTVRDRGADGNASSQALPRLRSPNGLTASIGITPSSGASPRSGPQQACMSFELGADTRVRPPLRALVRSITALAPRLGYREEQRHHRMVRSQLYGAAMSG